MCHGQADEIFGQNDDLLPTYARGKRYAEPGQVGLGKIRQLFGQQGDGCVIVLHQGLTLIDLGLPERLLRRQNELGGFLPRRCPAAAATSSP